MDTARDVIDAFGGATAFARIVGIKRSTASEMRRHDRIRGTYWVKVVEAARAQRIRGVTLEALARIHAE